jgi:hypothetical protein
MIGPLLFRQGLIFPARLTLRPILVAVLAWIARIVAVIAV